MKNFKKNQVIIFVIALMLVTAGYLNFTNQKNMEQNLLPTSSLADSEQMAAIGDATLVSANQVTQNTINNSEQSNNAETKTTTQTNVQETNTQINQTSSTVADNSYFMQSKLDRDNMYSQMLENFQKILETDNLTADEKTKAQEEIKRINNQKNAIMIAENLIKTKGFEDVVLFINNENVTGVIKADKLDEQQIAQIQNVITRELGVKVNKINISNKK